MALISTTIAGSGKYLYRASTTPSVNLRASHTIMVRCKWGATTTSGYRYSTAFYSTAGTSGSFLGRVPSGTDGEGTTTTRATRVSTASVFNKVTHTGSYGDTTTWRHFAMTYDATSAIITYYLDGVSIGTVSSATTLVANSTGAIWHGIANAKTADLAFFNRALTSGEVADMAAYREPQVTSGLTGFWRLDTNNSGGSTEGAAADTSGNGNTISVTGSGATLSYSTADNPPQAERPPVDVAGANTSTFSTAGNASLVRNVAGANTGTLSTAAAPNRVLAAAGAATATLSTAATPNRILNVAGANTGTLSTAATPNRILNVAGANTGTLSTTGNAVQVYSAAGASTATLSTAGAPGHYFGAAGSSTATLSTAATPNLVRNAEGASTATLSTAATPNLVRNQAGANTGALSTAGNASLVFNVAGAATATLSTAGDAAAEGFVNVAGATTATLSTTAAAQSVFGAAGASTGTLSTAGAAAQIQNAAGSNTGTLSTAATPNMVLNAAGASTGTLSTEATPNLVLGAAGANAGTLSTAGAAAQIQNAAGANTSALSTTGDAAQVLGAAGDVTATLSTAGDALGSAINVAGAVTATLGTAGDATVYLDNTGRRFSNYANYNTATWGFDAAQDWSVCGWLYIVASSGSGNQGDVFYSEDTANPGNTSAIRLGYTSDAGADPSLRFRVPGLNLTVPALTGTWYHMALTYDGTTARAYVDGVLAGSATVSGTFTHDRVDLGDFAFGGTTVEVAQVKVWEGHALTVGELSDEMLYWEPQTAVADVFAWWQLRNSNPTLDSSGNGKTLIEAGFVPDDFGLIPVPGDAAPVVVYDVAGANNGAFSTTGNAVMVFVASATVQATLGTAATPNRILNAVGAVSASLNTAGVVQLTRAVAGSTTATLSTAGIVTATRATAPWVADTVVGPYSAHGAWATDPTEGAQHTSWIADVTGDYAEHEPWRNAS